MRPKQKWLLLSQEPLAYNISETRFKSPSRNRLGRRGLTSIVEAAPSLITSARS